MPFINRIMGSGISAQAANNILGDCSAALTASGTTKTTALALSASNNYVAICSSGKAVSLPAMALGDEVLVANNGSNNLLVFTQSSSTDAFTNQSAGASYTLSVQKTASFNKMTSTVIMIIKSS